jgi:hypothetical protein
VVQAKFHRVRQVARRVTGEALPTWACMESIAAEALSALPDAAEPGLRPGQQPLLRYRSGDQLSAPAVRTAS